jgi:hypothetical protein
LAPIGLQQGPDGPLKDTTTPEEDMAIDGEEMMEAKDPVIDV